MAVEIYSTVVCPYCINAKQLLDAKGIDYVEYFIDKVPNKLSEMLERCDNRNTVPQIIIHGKAIGGFDNLQQLELSGKLNSLLNQTGEK